MTDEAESYNCGGEECKLWFEENHSVSNSRKLMAELSRSTVVLADVASRAMRSGIAGTQTIDAEWGFIKEFLSQNRSAKTEAARQHIYFSVRRAQWLRMCSTHDRWPRFCEAAQRWMQAKAERRIGPEGEQDERERSFAISGSSFGRGVRTIRAVGPLSSLR